MKWFILVFKWALLRIAWNEPETHDSDFTYRHLSAILLYVPYAQVLRKMSLKCWASGYFGALLNWELGIIPTAENYSELFKRTCFIGFLTLF